MLDRRAFLRSLGVGGAVLLTPRAVLALEHGDDDPPRTGFEERDGASWTTHEEELDFLDEVAARSDRVAVDVIGETREGRPLHLVRIGAPGPPAARIAEQPTVMFVGTQHGNEPAGREALLIRLRDLAFTDDPVLVRQLEEHSVLVLPTANPDGRARNIRTNGVTDINRDHLGLTQPEIQAMHAVIRDWQPGAILDHHEYGPSLPVIYDSDILYLWPRNLNVDPGVRDLSRTLCEEYIAKGARGAGYSADVYGIYKAGPNEITQTAGGPDEGICRNAVGLRHSLGILIESAVSQSVTPERGLDEVLDSAANNRRRVFSQVQTVDDTLRFFRDQGHIATFATAQAPLLAAQAGQERSRPTWWGGADNQEPSANQIDDPPACHYELTAAQAEQLAQTFALHGIALDGLSASLGQAARPVIPLLLDSRGSRNVTSATAVYDCD